MKYENRTIPEGINVSEEHPLKEFVILAFGLGAMTVLVVALLSFMAGWLVHLIPFSIEKSLSTSSFAASISDRVDLTKEQQRIESYLQQLADELVVAQQLPEGMDVVVHYVDDDTVNAFATLGGNLIMYRGLIERLPHENALAMLLSHEIAHIKQRAPIVALGRGVAVGLALASISGFGDSSMSQQLVGNVGLLTSLSFSRQQEDQADIEALQTLERYYGHTRGAESLFEVLNEGSNVFNPPEILSTHPVTQERIKRVDSFNEKSSELVPYKNLPDFLMKEFKTAN
jgi:predicted Zn-dependent protease